jgi:hypothetical protein
MKNYKIFAVTYVLAAALGLFASAARAQLGQALMAAPIVTRVISHVLPKGTPAGTNWIKAEVVHADANTIIVREQANEMAIHTFNFAPELRDKMQAMLDKGGYQYGDKIDILYQPNQTVALRIHGKPSKPL